MITEITRQNISQIKNPAFASYASIYLDIYDDFMRQVRETGIEIEHEATKGDRRAQLETLAADGCHVRNGGRSFFANAISPACVACQKGIGSVTLFISLQCHRDCYYCFNPNQENYETFRQESRDWLSDLKQIYADGGHLQHIALTGGEPLLHRHEAVAFFQVAGEWFPNAFTRLYTCGDHVDTEILRRLKGAGLDEIRFSIRMHDWQKGNRHTLDRIALAREHIPFVMVEMPVMPGTRVEMEEILLALDELEIHSINLLELCYPLGNAEEFNRRSFRAKRRPYQVLYNYWYAGGIPVAGSEELCLDLLAFVLEKDLALGVHYCSLENKLTGQNYQQNFGRPAPKTATFSRKDYLYKTAKVFGRDIGRVSRALRLRGCRTFQRNRRHDYLEFPVAQIPDLSEMEVEVGLCSGTLEERSDGAYLRELKVDLTTPATFDLTHDL